MKKEKARGIRHISPGFRHYFMFLVFFAVFYVSYRLNLRPASKLNMNGLSVLMLFGWLLGK